MLTLDAEEYSFRDKDGSTITISMQATKESNECDAYFAFSVGDQQYLTFVTDFDGNYNANFGNGAARYGIFVYPSCGSNSIESGDASGLIPSASDFSRTTIRNAMTGGDMANFHLLSSTQNGNNFPITFEFINNAISDTFTFKFSSPTFATPLECTYNSAVAVGQNFKFYITPDGGNEEIHIESFTVNGYDMLYLEML